MQYITLSLYVNPIYINLKPMPLNTTIVAESTPRGKGAISMIRLSGPQAFEILQKISLRALPKGLRALTVLHDEKQLEFDRALVHIFRSPHSFTGEDTVEFHCHGSTLIVHKLLKSCLHYGALLASPGEFTQRAFLNGKMDLVEAEAVLDLISTKSEILLKAASKQLGGSLATKLQSIEAHLTQALGLIHGPLDFPLESEEAEVDLKAVFRHLKEAEKALLNLQNGAQAASIFRQGLKTVILGQPNVGKSSLLNLLLKQERAIVSTEPGTTRDFLAEELSIRDIPILLIDTAGLRHDPETHIEQLGIQKSLQLSEEAELILFLFDGSQGLSPAEEKLLQDLKIKNAQAKIILLANKADLHFAASKLPAECIVFSAKTGQGLKELEDKIEGYLGIDPLEGDFEFAITSRQALLLENASDQLRKALNENSPEIISVQLENCLQELKAIMGNSRFASDASVSAIFSNFCIGK